MPEEYEEDHLPGALYLDTNWLENPDDWNRRSPEELEAALRALGITHDTTVILYGRDTEGDANEKWPGRRAGPDRRDARGADPALRRRRRRPAARRRLRLVGPGGQPARDRRSASRRRSRRSASPIPQRPEVIVDIDEAKQILADPEGAALVSVRTWHEHIGKVSGYNYIGPAGRIAGDVWGNCGTDAYHMQHYRNVDNTMRAYPEIAANWARGRHHGRQVGRLLLRHRLAGERDVVLRLPDGLARGSRSTTAAGSSGARIPVNNPIEIGDPDDIVAA